MRVFIFTAVLLLWSVSVFAAATPVTYGFTCFSTSQGKKCAGNSHDTARIIGGLGGTTTGTPIPTFANLSTGCAPVTFANPVTLYITGVNPTRTWHLSQYCEVIPINGAKLQPQAGTTLTYAGSTSRWPYPYPTSVDMSAGGTIIFPNGVPGTVPAANITAGIITGSTFQTASSGQRFVVDQASNSAKFYNAAGKENILIGDPGDGSGTGYYINLGPGAGIGGVSTDSTGGLNVMTTGGQGGFISSTANNALQVQSGCNGGGACASYTLPALPVFSYRGIAITGQSNYNYGAQFGANSTTGAVNLIPQTVEPSTHANGDMFLYSGTGMGGAGLYLGTGTAWTKVTTSGSY